MLKLKDIKNDTIISGIEPDQVVRVVTTEPVGDSALSIHYKTPCGNFMKRILFRTDEPNLSLAEKGAFATTLYQDSLDPRYGRTVFKLTSTFPEKTVRVLLAIFFAALVSASFFHDRLVPRPGETNRASLGNLHETGLAGVEFGHGDYWRWGLGPESTITFTTGEKKLVLHYVFNNPLPEQNVCIYFNGKLLREYSHLQACAFAACLTEGDLRLKPRDGQNTLRIVYSDYNGAGKRFSPDDRPYALCYHRLYISRD